MAECVIYARVSTREQADEGYSIPAQLKALEAFCAAEKLTIAECFIEMESARRIGRRAFGQMLAYLAAHPGVRIVVAHKQDRLYRNFADKGTLEDALGVRTRYVVGDLGDGPEGELVRDVNLSVSKWYGANLRQEVIKGMQEKVEQGGWPHQAPLGYLNDRNSRSLVVDPDATPLVVCAFERYATGLVSLSQLAAELEGRGLRSKRGGKVGTATLHHVLHNPLYAGLVRYCGRLYPGVHEPLISMQLFERVQSALNPNREANKGVRHVFVLRDFMTCDVCGCKITAERQKGHVYYRCTHGKGRDLCAERRYTREEALMAQVEEVLGRIAISPQVVTALAAAARERDARSGSNVEQERARLSRQIESVRTRQGALLDKLLDGTVSDEIYRSKEAQLQEELVTFELRLAELDAAPKDTSSQVERLAAVASAARVTFEAGSDEVKREVLATVLSNLTVKEGRIASYQWKDPFGVLEMDSSGAFYQSWWARKDSNLQPRDYESPAPPLSYGPHSSAAV